jgi:putative protease
MTKRSVELLAPAGNMTALIGAINAGANAVYLAGNRFGARAFADNFSNEEIKAAIEYAHLRNVFVYITINTLIFDHEIDDLLAFSDDVVKLGADALIVQDLGMMDLFLKRYPDTDIHLSTQMNIHHISQVRFFESLGVKRIVLAREVSYEDIKELIKQSSIEIEVFIHGALCVSFSGQCLMSYFSGGRSANRGACAQPCRLPYLMDQDIHQQPSDYPMSMKDLMTLTEIHKLIDLGITSFKIEGRMRRPEYVVQTVLSYRKAIDLYRAHQPMDIDEDIVQLKKVFNRDFTKGFMLNQNKSDMISHTFSNHQGTPLGRVIDMKHNKVKIRLTDTLRVKDGYRILGEHSSGEMVSRILKNGIPILEAYPNDIIELDLKLPVFVDSDVLKTKDSLLEMELQKYLVPSKISISGVLSIEHGKKGTLELTKDSYHKVFETDFVIEKALSKPLDQMNLRKQMTKLGDTPFVFESLDINTDQSSFISVGQLNHFRRTSMESFIKIITDKKKTILDLTHESIPKMLESAIWISVQKPEQLTTIQTILSKKKDEINHKISIINANEDTYKRIIKNPLKPLKKGDMIRHTGYLSTIKGIKEIISDYTLNVTNSYTICFLHRHHIEDIVVSLEMSVEQTLKTFDTYQKIVGYEPKLVMMVYGRPEVMIIASDILKPNQTQDTLIGKDKKNYPVVKRENQTIVYGHEPIVLLNKQKALMDKKIGLYLSFTIENEEETKQMMHAFLRNL